jgi:hypothetical protein
MNYEDKIFEAAIKLLAHENISIDRAVKMAEEVWKKTHPRPTREI